MKHIKLAQCYLYEHASTRQHIEYAPQALQQINLRRAAPPSRLESSLEGSLARLPSASIVERIH